MKRLAAVIERWLERWRPQSLLGRTLLPVVGGLVLLAAIFGLVWVAAVLMSRGSIESSERLAPTRFELGGIEQWSEHVAEDGPLLFPGLAGTAEERVVVVFHEGDDPELGWTTYWGYPAGGDPSCIVAQVERTRRFVDPCSGETIDVTDLARTDDLCPIIENRTRLAIGLRAEVCRSVST